MLMESLVRRNLKKTKSDLISLLSKLKTEIPLAILQGAIPVIWFSAKESDVEAILGGLLAGDQLIKYSCYLLAPYALILLIKFSVRLSFDSSREKLEYIQELISEVGPWFLTISRTGAGAAMGCLLLVHTTEIITARPDEIFRTYFGVFMLLFFNCALVYFKDEVMKKIHPKPPKNPYRLDRRLR